MNHLNTGAFPPTDPMAVVMHGGFRRMLCRFPHEHRA